MVILPHYKLEYYYYLLNVTDEDYDVSEHHIVKCTVHSAQYLIWSRNMSRISSLVDGRVREHSRNVLVLSIEMSRHNPPLRKPDLTREVKNAIWMLHLAELLQQHWLPLVDET